MEEKAIDLKLIVRGAIVNERQNWILGYP